MKLLQGIRLSFRLQQIIQNDPVVVRGYRIVKEGDLPSAMNGYLYSILKNTKSQRRGILMSLLKQFDESSVSLVKNKALILHASIRCLHGWFFSEKFVEHDAVPGRQLSLHSLHGSG